MTEEEIILLQSTMQSHSFHFHILYNSTNSELLWNIRFIIIKSQESEENNSKAIILKGYFSYVTNTSIMKQEHIQSL